MGNAYTSSLTKMKNIFWIIFLLFPYLMNLQAQEGVVLEGFILDKESGKGIEQVEVRISPGGHFQLSDAFGYYRISNLKTGKYTISYNQLGYKPSKEIVHAGKTGIYRINVQLQPKIKTLDEVNILGEIESKRSYQTNQVSQLELRESPVRDIGDYLRKTPNLSGIRKGGIGIDPVMRGFKNKQLNVVTNGGLKIEGGCPNRMDPAVSHIEADDISEIEILKGPYALRYGPSFGGVIHLKTLKPRPYSEFSNRITALQGFESNWNGSKQHLNISGGNQNVYYIFTGNYKQYGNYQAGNGQEIRSAFTKYNYSIQLGLSPVKNQEYIFSYDRSYGRNVSFPALPMDERSDDTRLLSFDYTLKNIGKHWEKFRIKLYHSDVHHIMDNKERPFSDTVVAVSDITAVNYGGRLESFLQIGNQKILLGIDLEKIWKNGQRNKNLILQPGLPIKIEDLWKHALISNTGLYASWDRKARQFDLSMSLRLDLNRAESDPLMLKNMKGEVIYENNNTKSSFDNFSLSVGVLWNISEETGLGLTMGRGIRSPDLTERYIILLPVGYDRYDYLGNPELKPEKNHQADLKAFYRNRRLGNFEANAFFSFVTDFITSQLVPESSVKPQTQGVLGVKEFYNEDHVYLYGFEFSYASPARGKIGFAANAALTLGVNPDATRYIIENGEVSGEEKIGSDPLPEIPPLEANLRLNYKIIPEKLKTALSLRLVSSQGHTSRAFYEAETPGFALADFMLNYRYSDVLSINGGVNNIFDKAYYEHLNRRIIGSMMPLYEPGRVFYLNLILNI